MKEITLTRPLDEDVCCRCGIPRRIGCHHDKDRKPQEPEERD